MSQEIRQKVIRLKKELNYDKPTSKMVRWVRYYSVLYIAIESIAFREEVFVKDGITYCSASRLSAVAKAIGLNFDRTKSARIVFEDGIQRNEILKIRDDDNTECYTLTSAGKETCSNSLEELNQYYNNPRVDEAEAVLARRNRPRPSNSISMYYIQPPDSELDELLKRIKIISRNLNIE